jgi:hypothetical protein
MQVEVSTENSYQIWLFMRQKNILSNFCAVQGVQAILQGAAEGALPLHLQGVPPDLSLDQERVWFGFLAATCYDIIHS